MMRSVIGIESVFLLLLLLAPEARAIKLFDLLEKTKKFSQELRPLLSEMLTRFPSASPTPTAITQAVSSKRSPQYSRKPLINQFVAHGGRSKPRLYRWLVADPTRWAPKGHPTPPPLLWHHQKLDDGQSEVYFLDWRMRSALRHGNRLDGHNFDTIFGDTFITLLDNSQAVVRHPHDPAQALPRPEISLQVYPEQKKATATVVDHPDMVLVAFKYSFQYQCYKPTRLIGPDMEETFRIRPSTLFALLPRGVMNTRLWQHCYLSEGLGDLHTIAFNMYTEPVLYAHRMLNPNLDHPIILFRPKMFASPEDQAAYFAKGKERERKRQSRASLQFAPSQREGTQLTAQELVSKVNSVLGDFADFLGEESRPKKDTYVGGIPAAIKEAQVGMHQLADALGVGLAHEEEAVRRGIKAILDQSCRILGDLDKFGTTFGPKEPKGNAALKKLDGSTREMRKLLQELSDTREEMAAAFNSEDPKRLYAAYDRIWPSISARRGPEWPRAQSVRELVAQYDAELRDITRDMEMAKQELDQAEQVIASYVAEQAQKQETAAIARYEQTWEHQSLLQVELEDLLRQTCRLIEQEGQLLVQQHEELQLGSQGPRALRRAPDRRHPGIVGAEEFSYEIDWPLFLRETNPKYSWPPRLDQPRRPPLPQGFPVVMTDDAEREKLFPELPPRRLNPVTYWGYASLPQLSNPGSRRHQGGRGEHALLRETMEIDVYSEQDVAGDESKYDTDEDTAAMEGVDYDTEEEDMTAMEDVGHLADHGKSVNRCALSYLCG